MKIIFLLLIFTLTSIYSETIYYNSNKSGMILDQVKFEERGDFYISCDIDNNRWIKVYTFYENSGVKEKTEEFYDFNFNSLVKKLITKNNHSDTEFYRDGLLVSLEKYQDGELITTSVYGYSSDRLLLAVEVFDSGDNLVYTEKYFRNSDGALRKVIKNSKDSYYLHWFYDNGMITESWLVEDNKSTRTQYNKDGSFSNIVIYMDSEVLSSETFSYQNGILSSSIKTAGTGRIEKLFNSEGVVTRKTEFNNDILTRRVSYTYENNLLSKESISGHGKREEFIYKRDDDDKVITTIHNINGLLESKIIKEDDNNEIYEYYRNSTLYLKEFFNQGELVKKELYLDGVLFKSESFSE